MTFHRRSAASIVALLLAMSAGCSDATPGEMNEAPTVDAATGDEGEQAFTPLGDLTVDTGVSNDGPLAGELVQVFCTVGGLAPGQAPPTTRWELYDDPPGVTQEPLVEGDFVTFYTTGTYKARCVIEATGWTDPTAVKLYVGPGEALNVDTVVTPDVLAAGETAEVSCSGEDAWGNAIELGWNILITPAGPEPGIPDGMVSANFKVKALSIGTYDVACAQVAGKTDPTPVLVWVSHGLPHKLVTELDDDTIVAGTSTGISCRAEDKWGNEVPDLPMTVNVPSKLSLDGFAITGTVTGKYTLKCVPAALDWTSFVLEHDVLKVIPDVPITLEIVPQPPAPYYPTFEVVQLVVLAHDQYENPIVDPEVDPIELWPEDAPHSTPSATSFIFFEEGTYTLTTRITEIPDLEASVEVFIEGDPPSVTVIYPQRAATIVGSKPSVTVEGLANDTIAGVASVRVNGQEAALHGDGTWTAIIIPKWGLNVLKVEAEDDSEKVTTVIQSFYFAEKYYPLDPEIPFVGDSIKVWLDDQFIDDGVHNPTHPDDLATILEAVLAAFDLNGALPSGMPVGGGYEVSLYNLSMNPPKLNLDPIWGGLKIYVEIKNLHIDIALKGECKVLGIDLCPDFSGSIEIGKLNLEADLLAAAQNADLQVLLTNPDVQIEAFDIDVDGILGWLFDWLLDFIVGLFTSTIEAAFEDQLADALGDTLVDIFDALALSETFEIAAPLPGMDDITLTLETQVHSLAFTPDGGRLGLGARLDGTKKVPQNILGSIARGSCVKGYPVNWQVPGQNNYEVAIYDDFLNLALASIWYSNVLNLSLDKEDMAGLLGEGGTEDFPLPVDDITLDLTWPLPPIVNGCDPSGVVILQLGDLFVDMDLFSLLFDEGLGEIGVYLSVEVSAELVMTEGDEGTELGIQILDMERLDFHWAYVPDVFIGAEEALEDIIKDQLIASLLEDLKAEPLGGFAIPELDLVSVSPYFPEGSVLVPVVENLSRDGGHTLLEGYLE